MPNFRSKKLLIVMMVAIISIAWFGVAKALFNPQINYQGKLTNNSDAAVTDGTYNMQFKLCSDTECVAELWSEVRTSTNKVQVTNGLFSVMLGEVATTSLSTVDFNQDVYLELQVGGTGTPSFEILLPRKRFGSVPNAFNTAKLGGKLEAEFGTLAENEIITGAWNFNNILSITANSSSPALSILQSGAGTGISVGNGTSTTTINGGSTSTFPYGATFATVGGNVGIGTTSPSYKLSVAGDIDTTGTIRINGADYGQYFISSAGTTGQLWQSDGSAAGAWVNTSSLGILPNGSTGQTIRYGVSGWESSSALTVNASGYVGIGTASPITILTNSATNSSDYRGYGVQLGTGLVWKASGAGYGIAFEQTATGAARNGALFKTASADADAVIFVAESGSAGRIVARADGFVGFNILTDYSGISANYTFNQLVKTSGSPTMMLLTAAAHTTLAASTEATDLNFNLARTVQFSTGAITTQRAAVIRAPTYGAVGASTISTAATFALTGAPISGTNVTITNPLALWVQSGNSQFDGGNITHTATGSPTLKSTFSSNSSANGIFVSGKYLYIADYTSGLKVMDISNPTTPIQVGVLAGIEARSVYVSGRYAYVGVSNGLVIVDISNPFTPILVGTLSGRGIAKGIYVSGKYAYVADYTKGLSVIDISNPSSPTLRGNYSIDSASGIYVSGKYAYVSITDVYSLRIIDISNPSSPILVGTGLANGSSDYQGIHVSGKYAYVAASTAASGLKIVDISNPALPVVTSTLALPEGASGIYVSGKYAYMAHGATGMSVVNISNPIAPLLVGTLDTTAATKVFVSGKYAYVLDGTGGTRIIDINGIDTPALNAGNIATGDLTVYENVDIGNNLYVRSGLNVGVGGLLSNGAIAITVSTTISTTTLFSVGTSTPLFMVSADGSVKINVTSSYATNYKLLVDGGSDTSAGIGVNGYIKASGFITGTTTLDLAETYPFDLSCVARGDCPVNGDLVCVDSALSTGVKKCAASSAEGLIGVVSANPGFLLGGSEFGDLQATNTAKIALSGRVPVKVNITSGTIKIGDELTIGTIDGTAKKALEPGQVIGIALENFGVENESYPQTGSVLLFVNPHWSIGSLEEKDIPNDLPDFTAITPNLLDKFTLAIENSLQKLGLVIKNGVAKLKEIFVDKIFTKQLCVGETCIGEQQLKDLLQNSQVSAVVQTAPLVNTQSFSPPAILNDTASSFSLFTSSSPEVENNVITPETIVQDTVLDQVDIIQESTVPVASTDQVTTIIPIDPAPPAI